MSQKQDPIKVLIEQLPLIDVSNFALELECRFDIDARKQIDNKRHFKLNCNTLNVADTIALAKHIVSDTLTQKQPSEIEQSINFITESNHITTRLFKNGEQQKDYKRFYSKDRLIEPIVVNHDNDVPISYKIAVSAETPIKEFDPIICKTARIKLRFSIAKEQWRLDITLVKNIDQLSDLSALKAAKTKMLGVISADTFVEKAPWEYADLIEFEAEYTDDYSNLSEESFVAADTILADYYQFINDRLAQYDADDHDGKSNNHGIKSNNNDKSNNHDKSNNNDKSNNRNNNNNKYQEMIYLVARYIKRNYERFKFKLGIKQLSNQVIELDKNIYLRDVHRHITDYYITNKVDGKRTIIYALNGTVWAISDALYSVGKCEVGPDYIFDTEEYVESGIKSYYIFDVLVWEGVAIHEKPFYTRMGYFAKASELFPCIKEKQFVRLTADYKKQITDFKASPPPYEIDGLILTPYDGTYNDMTVYKYKPRNKLSVDFLIKKCPTGLLGIKPYDKREEPLYLLFCGISKMSFDKLRMTRIKYYNKLFDKEFADYFPIQFEPSDKPLAHCYYANEKDIERINSAEHSDKVNYVNKVAEYDKVAEHDNQDKKQPDQETQDDKQPTYTEDSLDGLVGEFYYDMTSQTWQLNRIRTDRAVEVQRGNYFGNNYKIAELTWLNFHTSLSIETLEDNADVYFQINESTLHKASRNYNGFVKSKNINMVKDAEWVMDLASGKGQDLFRYSKANVENVLFVEIDSVALMELISRKHDFSNSTDRSLHNMRCYTQNLDLLTDYEKNISTIGANAIPTPVLGFDVIQCNFAFHYFLQSKATALNVVRFISHYLKKGGRFIMTAFDGRAIVELLEKHNGEWQSAVAGKFKIKKNYQAAGLLPFGQQIQVLLPFSADELYNEYLVNLDSISELFSKFNIVLESDTSFGEYLTDYKKSNLNNYQAMDADDKLYVSLYHTYCFYRKR